MDEIKDVIKFEEVKKLEQEKIDRAKFFTKKQDLAALIVDMDYPNRRSGYELLKEAYLWGNPHMRQYDE